MARRPKPDACAARSLSRSPRPGLVDWWRIAGSSAGNAPRTGPKRNGGRHCCQPPSAPSEGSAGVRQLLRPEGHLLLDPGSPAQASLPKIDPNPKTGSFPSAALLGPIPFRAACVPRDTAFRARKTGSSGASSGWSDLEPKFRLIAFRWRSDLPSRPSEEGWDFRPDHPLNMRTFPSRAKRNLAHQACG